MRYRITGNGKMGKMVNFDPEELGACSLFTAS